MFYYWNEKNDYLGMQGPKSHRLHFEILSELTIRISQWAKANQEYQVWTVDSQD